MRVPVRRLLLLFCLIMVSRALSNVARPKLKSVDYEVFGRVQGVCFRMYAEDEARRHGVVGWVKNTGEGTVTGQVQGPEDKVNLIPMMTWAPVGAGMDWLSKVGSPSSRIDQIQFSNEKEIDKLEFKEFVTKY
uniref:Acylphosphatase n=1 Tax=Geotrypetes seraphini TaxID=260995 RepID=A0A6P8Q8A2_GEOSA|nr:acylphosphatase-2 isoform X1 [Geotrypetes seraphini]